MSTSINTDEQLLTPSEVAAMFRVDTRTVTRWAKAGKLPYIRTIGGHRRFHRHAIDAHLQTHSSGESAA